MVILDYVNDSYHVLLLLFDFYLLSFYHVEIGFDILLVNDYEFLNYIDDNCLLKETLIYDHLTCVVFWENQQKSMDEQINYIFNFYSLYLFGEFSCVWESRRRFGIGSFATERERELFSLKKKSIPRISYKNIFLRMKGVVESFIFHLTVYIHKQWYFMKYIHLQQKWEKIKT